MSATSAAAISAKHLHVLLASSQELALLNVRQPRATAEHGSILLGVSLPLGVLELRVGGLVPRRSTTVVVYSAAADGLAHLAQTRLAALGYTDVTVLDGGIEAWAEAGFKVHTGGDNVIGQAFGEWIEVAPWVFRRAATHNARIVLVDNDQVRATVAASWLIQFGWGEIYVLADALADERLETGSVAWPVLGLPETGKRLVCVDAAQRLLAEDAAAIVDLRPSPDYRKAHVPTAVFANRAGLAGVAADIPGEGPILLISEDGVLASFAAAELAQATQRPVRVLDGGFAAWQRAGLPVDSGTENFLTEVDDVVASGWRETDLERRKAGFRRYLSWEQGLVAELDADDTVPFKSFGR